jgi:hypothetical protein
VHVGHLIQEVLPQDLFWIWVSKWSSIGDSLTQRNANGDDGRFPFCHWYSRFTVHFTHTTPGQTTTPGAVCRLRWWSGLVFDAVKVVALGVSHDRASASASALTPAASSARVLCHFRHLTGPFLSASTDKSLRLPLLLLSWTQGNNSFTNPSFHSPVRA